MDRNVKYDYYRAIACIGVIFIHVFYSCNLIYGSSYSKSNNLVNNVLLNNFMWAVPAFFVITGALLLDKNKKITLGKLFSKYILRVLVALILFGTAFSVIDVFFGDKTPGLKAFFLNLYDVFKGKSWSHLWYLYCIIGIYLLLPFYKMAADNSDRKLLIYLLVVYAVFLSIVPLLNAFNIKTGFYIHVSTIYPFYLFLGLLIDRYCAKLKSWYYVWILIISTVLIAVFTIIGILYDNTAVSALFKYNSILIIFQVFAVSGLFFKIKNKAGRVVDFILKEINKNSFGIYLIHMIFVRVFYKHMNINPYEYGGVLMIVLVVLVILVISDLSIRLLKLIPAFKRIF